VAGTVIQNGLTQRSYVDRLQIDFSEQTNLGGLISSGMITSAVTLTNLGVNAPVDGDQIVALFANQFRYEFDATAGVSRLTWSLDAFGAGKLSLADGFHRFTLDPAQIKDLAGNSLDGDGNGTAGGSFVASFHRLEGDADGNRLVDTADMDLVNAALGAMPTSATWNTNADLDRDSRITVRDRLLVARATGHAITPSAVAAPASATSLPSDFNVDGIVDAADYVMWRQDAGQLGGHIASDANAGYQTWRQNFGHTTAGSAEQDDHQALSEVASKFEAVAFSAKLSVPNDEQHAHDQVFTALADARESSHARRSRPGTFRPRPSAFLRPADDVGLLVQSLERTVLIDDVFVGDRLQPSMLVGVDDDPEVDEHSFDKAIGEATLLDLV
jgi:hypothetical protein